MLEDSLALEAKLSLIVKQQPQGEMGYLVDGQRRRVHNKPFLQRFYEKVNKLGPIPEHRPDLGPCWIWLAHMNKGYGIIGMRGINYFAHRIAFTLDNETIPDGMTLDHLCKNRACVNPSHLEPVTIKINVLRGESGPAINSRKTMCDHGHEFTPENTRITAHGRECKKCKRIHDLKYYHAHKNNHKWKVTALTP